MGKITSFKVGGTFDTNIEYTNHHLEIQYNLDDGEDFQEALNNCKKLIAEAVSNRKGEYRQALKVMSYTSIDEDIEQTIKDLELKEKQINELNEKLNSKFKDYQLLKNANNTLDKLEHLFEISNTSFIYWRMVKKVIESSIIKPSYQQYSETDKLLKSHGYLGKLEYLLETSETSAEFWQIIREIIYRDIKIEDFKKDDDEDFDNIM